MGRKPMDSDATQNLKPEDTQQDAPEGTRIGKLSRKKVFADFRRIARVERPRKS
jgi:hypothetical protein